MHLEKSHIPLYYQLEQVLRKQILSGELTPSDPIPTERELCDEFDISRTTVRQALISLEREGLLKRVQGKGTFVSHRLKGRAQFRLFGNLEDLFSDTAKTTLTLHSKQLIVPDEKIMKYMKLEKAEKLYLFEGVRELETEHKAFYQAYISRNIGRKIRMDGLNHPFLIQRVELESNQKIKRARQVIYAALTTEEMATYIELPAGYPLLVMSTTFFSYDNMSLGLSVNYFPADAYRRVAELERVLE